MGRSWQRVLKALTLTLALAGLAWVVVSAQRGARLTPDRRTAAPAASAFAAPREPDASTGDPEQGTDDAPRALDNLGFLPGSKSGFGGLGLRGPRGGDAGR